jgi:hypothetical protein
LEFAPYHAAFSSSTEIEPSVRILSIGPSFISAKERPFGLKAELQLQWIILMALYI